MIVAGVLPALVTPMDKDGAIDERAFQDIVNWQIDSGVNGLVPVGTTGESPTLSHPEHHRVVKLCIEATGGRVPVIAGTGSNNTAEAIMLTKQAQADGADAALVVTPYYNKPTQEGLYLHYQAIAQSTDLPIIIYNIPSRCVIDMSVETMARLARDFDNIVGVKDATADLVRPLQTRLACGEEFCQLSGEDATVIGFMAQGGHGEISVTANVAPDLCATMVRAWQINDWQTCARIRDLLMPLHSAMFCQSSPAPAKYALSLLGKCQDTVRLPIAPLSAENRVVVEDALKHCGLL